MIRLNLWFLTPVLFVAQEAAGAIGARLSLRPLFSGGTMSTQTSGGQRREKADAYPRRRSKVEPEKPRARAPDAVRGSSRCPAELAPKPGLAVRHEGAALCRIRGTRPKGPPKPPVCLHFPQPICPLVTGF